MWHTVIKTLMSEKYAFVSPDKPTVKKICDGNGTTYHFDASTFSFEISWTLLAHHYVYYKEK